MKKFLCFIMIFSSFLLSSCSLFGNGKHDHSYGGNWISTGGVHYKVCEKDGCNEVDEKGNHEFENGKCKICGYSQPTLN